MRQIVYLLITVTLALCCSCTVVNELPQENWSSTQKEDEELQLCRKLLHAFIKDKPKEFIQLLPIEIQQKFPIEQFNSTRSAMKKSLGDPCSFKFLTKLEFFTFNPYIWVIRFRHQGKNGSHIFREALFRIVTGRTKDNKIVIISFNFL